MKKHIPNFITLLNLGTGFIAIIFFFNGEIRTAAFLMVLALFFDFADGMAARFLKAGSELGKQLDSLADVVSFGVLPGLFMYHLILNASGAEQIKGFLVYVPVIIPVLSGLRLGIFNLDESQSDTFKGLPTPANGIFILGLTLAREFSESPLIEVLYSSRWTLVFFTLCFSILMITRIPMFSFKFKQIRFKGNELRIVFAILAILLAIGTGFASIPLIIILYITVSVIMAFVG